MISVKSLRPALLGAATLMLVAACGGGSASDLASGTASPSPAAAQSSPSADPRLPEGTYTTGRLTQAQLITAARANGLMQAQIEAVRSAYPAGHVVTFTLKIEAGKVTEFEARDGGPDEIGFSATYEVIDDSTVATTEACCGTTTFEYARAGDRLTFRFAERPNELCAADPLCWGGFVVWESAPFTKVD